LAVSVSLPGTNRVLITGANGFVGRALVHRLRLEGYWVRGAVRHMGDNLPLAPEWIAVGDIGWRTDWSAALSGIDVVIHLAARVHLLKDRSIDPLDEFRRVNVGGTEILAREAADKGVRRLIYVSSIGVLGDRTQGKPFTESDTPQPRRAYAISKWEAEQALQRVAQRTDLEVVIVRPPLVYGVGNPGNFLQLLKWVERGIPMPLASVDNLRSFLGVGNLVDFLVSCMVNCDAANQTFLVADGEDIATPELIRRIACWFGQSARLAPCPVWLLRLAGHLSGLSDAVARLTESLMVDASKARTLLGWNPPVSLNDGLRATVEWYRNCARSR
jgi:nucleoside-diphosphate-sugar epimerase